jgi:CheY-like chemotaxis protein
MQGDRERCLECGMDDYIAKPVRIDDLRSALDRQLNAVDALTDRAGASFGL